MQCYNYCVNTILQTLLSNLPAKRKTSISGWVSFNAVCCQNRGFTPDIKRRGGVLVKGESFTYHCFNCGYKAGYEYGEYLTVNVRNLFHWLGVSDTVVGQMNIAALKIKNEGVDTVKVETELIPQFNAVRLPPNTKSINTWIQEGCNDPNLMRCIDYIVNERRMGWDWYNWHWSPVITFRDRVLMPYYFNRQIVGYAGRKVVPGLPKYLVQSQHGYLFNTDAQDYSRKFLLVTEGQLDAIAIGGVALMHNVPNAIQIQLLKEYKDKQIIVVPDRDRPGLELIKAAVDNNWSVSFPQWEDDVKDAAEAVKRYGRLYTLQSILHYCESNPVAIQVKRKKLENELNSQLQR